MTELASDDDDDEEEEDWSDVSELQEVDSKPFQSTSDQNGNVDNRSFVKGERHAPFFLKFYSWTIWKCTNLFYFTSRT